MRCRRTRRRLTPDASRDRSRTPASGRVDMPLLVVRVRRRPAPGARPRAGVAPVRRRRAGPCAVRRPAAGARDRRPASVPRCDSRRTVDRSRSRRRGQLRAILSMLIALVRPQRRAPHEPFSPGANVRYSPPPRCRRSDVPNLISPVQRLVAAFRMPLRRDGRGAWPCAPRCRRSTPQRRGNLRSPVRHPRQRRRPPIVRRRGAVCRSTRRVIFFVGRQSRAGSRNVAFSAARRPRCTDDVLWVA